MSYKSIVLQDGPVGYWPLDELPALTITDSFTRTDSTTLLGSTDSGEAWTAIAGTWGINSNKAYLASPANDQLALFDAGVADCSFQCDITFQDSGDGIMFRGTGANAQSGYLCYLNSSQLSVLVPGFGAHVTGSPVSLSHTPGVAVTLRIDLSGNSIKIYENGNLKLSTTDATQPTATKFGLRSGGTTGTKRWDNLSLIHIPQAYNYGSTVGNGSYIDTPTGSLVNMPSLGAIPFPAGGRAPIFTKASSQYVSVPDNSAWSPQAGGSGKLTLEAWFWQASYTASTWQLLVQKGKASNYEYALQWSTNNDFRAEIANAAASAAIEVPMSPPQIRKWHHAAMTSDSNGGTPIVNLYFDGKFMSSATAAITTTDGTADLLFGNDSDFGATHYDGAIAHVALYNKILTHNRIRAHYLAGLNKKIKR